MDSANACTRAGNERGDGRSRPLHVAALQSRAVAAVGPAGYNSALSRLKGIKDQRLVAAKKPVKKVAKASKTTKSAAGKPAAKKSAASKQPVKKAPAKKVAVKKAAPPKAAAKKAAPAKTAKAPAKPAPKTAAR